MTLDELTHAQEPSIGLVPRASRRVVDTAPLTLAQQRLWLLQQVAPSDGSYNEMLAQRLRGSLSVVALQRAFDDVASRHEILRTRFTDIDGDPVQEILEPAPVRIDRIDLSAIAPDRRESELADVVAARTNGAFDLAAGPPVRVTLVALGPDDFVLSVVLHHIIFDGWSFEIFQQELGVCYNARLRGEAPQLPALAAQFSDYARAEGSAQARPESYAYWRELLADPPVLDLPTDRPRAPERSTDGAFVDHFLPADLMAAIRELARSRRCSPFMVLVAAFELLLARHAGQNEVCVASPVSARNREEYEPLLGYMTNLLLFRADIAADPTFGELLAATRKQFFQAFAYQDVPFEQLMHDLQIPRDASRTTLFQALVVMQTMADPTASAVPFDGIDSVWIDSGFDRAKYDVMLDMFPLHDGLRCNFGYSKQLFDEATILRLSARWDRLLREIVADPDRPVRSIPILADGEDAELARFGQGPPGTTEPSVLAAVEAMIAETPDAPAVAAGDVVVSYEELSVVARAIEQRLRAAGVESGELVAVSLPRGIDMVAALLAVWRVGAGYLAVDPALPATRAEALLADAGVAAVITEDGGGGIRAVAGGARSQIGDSAYVVYTSGSTGSPKGVVVSRAALAARVHWMVARYELTPADHVVQFAALGFDTHAEEIWPTLVAGATLVVLPDGPHSIDQVLAADPQISVLDLPTACWHRLVDAADLLAWPAALRLVIIGGEQAEAGAVAAWHSRFGDQVRLLNTYGPSEATIIATDADLTDTGRRPVIGRPIAGTCVRVVDPGGGPTPIGVPGELWIGGLGLADRYLRLPEETARRFVEDPAGTRWYRTGDRVRWLPDGTLEFLGRLDGQVKVRGHRIEPGEVEAHLCAQPLVSQAAVVARDDRLVAFVVTRADVAEVRDRVGETLPAWMVPDVVVALDALPTTSHGKIDRGALPAVDHTPPREQVHVAPRTDAEELVASIFAEVLGVKEVGATDDFFARGGHSLHAVRVVARLKAVIDLAVPLKTLFMCPTVAALAEHIESLIVDDLSALTDAEAEALLLADRERAHS